MGLNPFYEMNIAIGLPVFKSTTFLDSYKDWMAGWFAVYPPIKTTPNLFQFRIRMEWQVRRLGSRFELYDLENDPDAIGRTLQTAHADKSPSIRQELLGGGETKSDICFPGAPSSPLFGRRRKGPVPEVPLPAALKHQIILKSLNFEV
ncbi:MAG: hypothetical protein WCP55_22410 [Lentisphaerota bacterium]